jgi:hypothetical protein
MKSIGASQKARLKSPTNGARDEAAAEHLGKLIK